MSALGGLDGGSVASDRADLPVVVVGGYDYAPTMNQLSTLMVRELARTRTVLYINSEVGGSLLNVLRGRGLYVPFGRLARVAFGATRARRVERHLWVASLRGPVAYTGLSYPEPTRRYAVRVVTGIIEEWLTERGADACLLLSYWPELPELAQAVPHAASAYDCSDDFATMPGRLAPSARVRNLEQRLLDTVDRTWVVSPGLREQRERPDRPVGVLPAPIDLRLFEEVTRGVPASLPALAGRTGPVMGYAGGLNDRMDWELLDEIAARRPEWTLLFIGEDPAAAPASLHGRSNVVFTGGVPYAEALRAIARFDVGIIPVRVGAFSRGNSFLKLADYLASGLPVVAADVPDTAGAAAREPLAVTVATGTDAWIAGLEGALRTASDEAADQARGRLLEERTTERRAAVLVGALEEDRIARQRAGG